MSAEILVVEDEFFIAQEIADALAEAGFAVLGPCASVPAALETLARSPSCAAAVLDASLRGASSLPVAEALAARGLPFAVVTGFSPDQLPPAMASAAAVLTKPLDGEAITAALHAMLGAA